MLLSLAGNPILEAAAAELSSKGLKVYSFTDETWGRILNDAFLFCLASEGVKYWVHTDDAHVCTRPFWQSLRGVLSVTGRELWHLQLSQEAGDYSAERFLKGDGYATLLRHEEEDDCGESVVWPIFSLRPFAQNLHHFRSAVLQRRMSLRPFGEEAGWCWDDQEWNYGLMLERLGAVKGVLEPAGFECVAHSEDETDQHMRWS